MGNVCTFHPLNLRLKANADKNLEIPWETVDFFYNIEGGKPVATYKVLCLKNLSLGLRFNIGLLGVQEVYGHDQTSAVQRLLLGMKFESLEYSVDNKLGKFNNLTQSAPVIESRIS